MATYTVSAHPTSYDTSHYSWYSQSSSQPISNGYADSNSTTYANFGLTRGANAETYVYYKFDFSSIPDGATNITVTAKGKGYSSTTSSSSIKKRQMQLATGTTLKGSALTLSNTATEQTFTDVGTWTRAELLNAGIRFYVQRNTSNTTSSYSMRVYGATMTVTYDYTPPGPSYDVRVKQNGAWVQATAVYAKQNGTWSEASQVLAKSGGTWHG